MAVRTVATLSFDRTSNHRAVIAEMVQHTVACHLLRPDVLPGCASNAYVSVSSPASFSPGRRDLSEGRSVPAVTLPSESLVCWLHLGTPFDLSASPLPWRTRHRPRWRRRVDGDRRDDHRSADSGTLEFGR